MTTLRGKGKVMDMTTPHLTRVVYRGHRYEKRVTDDGARWFLLLWNDEDDPEVTDAGVIEDLESRVPKAEQQALAIPDDPFEGLT